MKYLSMVFVVYTRLMQGLFGVLVKPIFGNKASPHCNDTIPASYAEHLFAKHRTDYNVDTIVRWLDNKNFNLALSEAIPSMKF